MLRIRLLALALASFGFTSIPSHASPFADMVVSYHPGVGFVPRFTNSAVALGEPSRINPFGETDPFDPPYGTNQIVSIGAGGHLVVRFQTPILNHPHNLYGLDFIIFGNSGFIITNDFDLTTYDWIGTPATDGSLFGSSTGETRISVSSDGRNFFQLNPTLAPTADSFPPTDGSGNYHIPVAPGLTQADLAGATLEGIRFLYNGSGGGAGYDISWAQDGRGQRIFLPEIRFIRIDVLSGHSEIDGFASVLRWQHDGTE
jgi:hypothetical protein